jgi:hypothetical protein
MGMNNEGQESTLVYQDPGTGASWRCRIFVDTKAGVFGVSNIDGHDSSTKDSKAEWTLPLKDVLELIRRTL